MAEHSGVVDIAAIASDHDKAETKSLLRVLTCGSVDDGKSTLIGRLLFDTNQIADDQLAMLARDSARHGTTGDDLDLALLVDGLRAEREQGITIDVAYRYFATDARKFIVADTPGHEHYTRNMATGASNCDLAVLLVDATKGIVTQTHRHCYIASLLGVRHMVLAVNKMDLVDFSQSVFERLRQEFMAFSDAFGLQSRVAIPVSARLGDNVTAFSPAMPWYDGPHLLDYLQEIEVADDREKLPLRMPVQWVNRRQADFRGYSGTIASGTVSAGEQIAVARSGVTATVARIVTMDGDLPRAQAGDAVTLVLDEDVDVSRGDLLVGADARPEVSDQFAAHVLWMSDSDLMPGRSYLLKTGAKTVTATVTELKYKVDLNTFDHLAAKILHKNEVAFCNLAVSEPIAFDAYDSNRATGSFILIDRLTNATVAAGMIVFGLRRATNIHRQALDVDQSARARMKQQKPVVLWFTGLSGSGKSTIANALENHLFARHCHTHLLDGDNVRHGLNRDLGFTDADRVENIRRIGEVAKLFVEAGLIVLVSFISPFRSERRMAREMMGEGEFIEIYVDTPIEECIIRDPKGLYKKAEAGQIKNFTGIDSPYEVPETAEMKVTTVDHSADELARQIIDYLVEQGVLPE